MILDFRIKINGKYVERFEETETTFCAAQGWTSYQRGVVNIPILTDDKEKALLIEGQINLKSYFDRIYTYLRTIDNHPLKIKNIEFEVIGSDEIV